eukprot:TRINITY_DN1427_c3_g3_i1.p1 TRINITY_DN1427_c3_g3~~TRINITY_DN1427_c3_g3_i1.p1  ORF type:complete len:570 (-),score=58.74 TRINITY_DN1427_c3_g3_i1:579-2288(-)
MEAVGVRSSVPPQTDQSFDPGAGFEGGVPVARISLDKDGTRGDARKERLDALLKELEMYRSVNFPARGSTRQAEYPTLLGGNRAGPSSDADQKKTDGKVQKSQPENVDDVIVAREHKSLRNPPYTLAVQKGISEDAMRFQSANEQRLKRQSSRDELQKSTQSNRSNRSNRSVRPFMGDQSPGPCDYDASASYWQSVAKKMPAATIGFGPGHNRGFSGVDDVTPGPADYHAEECRNWQLWASPRATIGRGPGHSLSLSPEPVPTKSFGRALSPRSGISTPSPASYPAESYEPKHSFRASFGRGPGHEASNFQQNRRQRWASHSPGPADYNPRRRSRSFHASFGTGPGHSTSAGPTVFVIDLLDPSTPGPCDCRVKEQRKHSYSASFGYGPGHSIPRSPRSQQQIDWSRCSPGPADYTPHSSSRGSMGRAESCYCRGTFGRGPGHDLGLASPRSLLNRLSSSPGPADYTHRESVHSPGASFGRSPRHDVMLSPRSIRRSAYLTPGPADYTKRELRKHSPSASFGRAPGHQATYDQSYLAGTAPGPADYQTDTACRKHSYQASFGTGPGHGY